MWNTLLSYVFGVNNLSCLLDACEKYLYTCVSASFFRNQSSALTFISFRFSGVFFCLYFLNFCNSIFFTSFDPIHHYLLLWNSVANRHLTKMIWIRFGCHFWIKTCHYFWHIDFIPILFSYTIILQFLFQFRCDAAENGNREKELLVEFGVLLSIPCACLHKNNSPKTGTAHQYV